MAAHLILFNRFTRIYVVNRDADVTLLIVKINCAGVPGHRSDHALFVHQQWVLQITVCKSHDQTRGRRSTMEVRKTVRTSNTYKIATTTPLANFSLFTRPIKPVMFIFPWLIIHMKKLLDSDWLRAVQFKCNTSAKSVTPVQKV